jgi:hypothetical protein
MNRREVWFASTRTSYSCDVEAQHNINEKTETGVREPILNTSSPSEDIFSLVDNVMLAWPT